MFVVPSSAAPMGAWAVPRTCPDRLSCGSASWDDDLKCCREGCALRRLATLPDAEWGGPPGPKDAVPEPPQAAGWEWELDANGVPVQRLTTTASATRGRRLRPDMRRTLPPRPTPHAAVIACMDSRLKIFELLGLDGEEAQVIRNAGGVITDDVIRSLAVSQRRLGTREVALIHHTDCGLQLITDDGFRAELQEATGMAPSFAIESFADVEVDVRQSIARVCHSPFLPHRDKVRGFAYDVDTGELVEIESDVRSPA